VRRRADGRQFIVGEILCLVDQNGKSYLFLLRCCGQVTDQFGQVGFQHADIGTAAGDVRKIKAKIPGASGVIRSLEAQCRFECFEHPSPSRWTSKIGKGAVESFAQGFAKGLSGASFDLGYHPGPVPGVLRELSQEDRLAYATQPVEDHWLSGAPVSLAQTPLARVPADRRGRQGRRVDGRPRANRGCVQRPCRECSDLYERIAFRYTGLDFAIRSGRHRLAGVGRHDS